MYRFTTSLVLVFIFLMQGKIRAAFFYTNYQKINFLNRARTCTLLFSEAFCQKYRFTTSLALIFFERVKCEKSTWCSTTELQNGLKIHCHSDWIRTSDHPINSRSNSILRHHSKYYFQRTFFYCHPSSRILGTKGDNLI